jgi:5-hydroxyisourate hydrolase-like protein (transthyretin family)
MRLPSHALIVPALLLSVVCLSQRASSQTKPESKTADATVSGKVTIKGKPAAGIVVGMRVNRPDEFSSTYKAKTDQEGVYHINKVPAGSYFVAPVAPTFVVPDSSNSSGGQSVIINESENVDGINFDLVSGGVITGKVTDSEGHPLIEERVTLMPADENNQRRQPFINGLSTDDRGVYRIFGVPAGRYKVSVGDPRFRGMNRRQVSAQTFYPDVSDAAKAGIVNVEEGSESTKIDITVGEAPQGYAVAGRVVDGDSGAPVANVFIQLTKIEIVDGSNTRGFPEYLDARSDAQGQFRLTNVRAGKYDVSISPPEDSDVRAEAPLRFDVIDQDVNGLVIKTTRGATIAGTIVFEGKNNPPQTSQMWIMVYTRNESTPGFSSARSVRVKPDGTFFAGGLAAGIANLNVEIQNAKGFTMARIERDGVVQSSGIQIQNGEHVSGVRLVMTFSSGSIRGVVRLENGTLPPTARLLVQIMKAGDQTPFPRAAEVDARGHFLIDGLPAGTYEIRVLAYAPEWQQQRRRPPMSVKQIVTVNESGATDVTLTLDLTPPPKQ